MPKYRVKRGFPSSEPMHVGKIVTDPNWRNLGLLIEQGYVEEITDGKKVAEVKQQPKIVEAPLIEQNVQETKVIDKKTAAKNK